MCIVDQACERARERLCCLTSTEARRPIRDGDEREKWDRRVKPRNRRQPGRPRLPWTAARTTGCYGSVRPALRSDHSTMQLLSQLICRTESQRRCPWLRRWETTEANEVQPSLAQHHHPALDVFWADFFVRVQLTSLLLISPGLCERLMMMVK